MQRYIKQILLPALLITMLMLAIILGYSIGWTGFGPSTQSGSTTTPAKTLWDWLELFLVPAVLFGLAQWYTHSQNKVERERQHVTEQYQLVQTFFEKIQSLILENKLRKSHAQDEVSTIARALLLTTLNQIDGDRKSSVITFLNELHLIQSSNRDLPIISLCGANLSGLGAPTGVVHLDFSGADLRFANLEGARIDLPNFEGADLEGAEVGGASFIYGNFRGANLEGTFLKGVNLFGAEFDERTRLPNGQPWKNTDLTEFGAILVPPITERERREVLRELQYPQEP